METLKADTVYLVMKNNTPVSRASRMQWLLKRLNTSIAFCPESKRKWLIDDEEFDILSIVSTEAFPSPSNQPTKYEITTNTKLKFIANSYRIVYCFDMSPSLSTIDIQCGEILLDEILSCFKSSLEGLCCPFTVPGSSAVIHPKIYLTVIAHTPFFMTPAQQVLIKGVEVTTSNLEKIFTTVERQFKILEDRISDVLGMMHDQNHENDYSLLVETSLNSQVASNFIRNIPMVSPDANFVNMLRYSMLALSLLPENSLSNIVIITDGVVVLPDVKLIESLLMQLHYDSTSISFIKVGSTYHPHVLAGYVPYPDILRFLSRSTMGMYLESMPEIIVNNTYQMNVFHKNILVWSFHTNLNEEMQVVGTSNANNPRWTTSNKYFYGQEAPVLLRKKQAEEKVNMSLLLLVSRRICAGFTVDKIRLENDLLHIELSLLWKNFVYLQYTITTQWPSIQNFVHYCVHVAAPYEFLHDITCLMKKDFKSTFRQAVVERFWYVLTHLASSDTYLAQHICSFQNSSVWYSLPESVKNKISTFNMVNSVPVDATKPQVVASDMVCPKFASTWQPICQLENSQWSKWFHSRKISIIVRHDDPLPRNLQVANSAGRFQTIQCRQSLSVINLKFSDWSSFVLIENHSYIKFLYKDQEKPTWFCIVRVTSKLPCAFINIGFINGTPGYLRRKIFEEINTELTQLCLPSLKYNANSACVLLQKPLEKILIRYERIPSDFNTVVFPDGTQPPNSGNLIQPVPIAGTLFTTLSRYLYHKRWIWNTTYLNTKLGINAIAQILNTITNMRLSEGYSFAHSASGIINMVLEVEMKPSCLNNDDSSTLSCVIQYVIFPPHYANRADMREYSSVSEDGSDYEQDSEIDLQIITEVWIEPQYGHVCNSPGARFYMENEPYHMIADKIGYVDSKCIRAMLTLEHISLMCQTKFNIEPDSNDKKCDNKSLIGPIKHILSDISDRKNIAEINEQLIQNGFSLEVTTPLMDERIHHVPFNFNLNNILPICPQSELLFSLFLEDESQKNQFELEKPNTILLESFYNNLHVLHDHELSIGPEDSYCFLELLYKKHVNCQRRDKCPFSLCPYVTELFLDQQPKSDVNYPKWRCYIKGLSQTHVILTFVPASLKDLKLLMTTSKMTRKFSSIFAPNDTTFTLRPSPGLGPSLDQLNPPDKLLILPVYIYDCPQSDLINFYIKCEQSSEEDVLNDVYENHLYKISQFDVEMTQNIIRNENDEVEMTSSVRQHCKTLVLLHSKCFIGSLFNSLRMKIPVHSLDVQFAILQCEKVVDEIEITEYLQLVCGHLKSNKETVTDLRTLFEDSYCEDLKPLHLLIQDKFIKITKSAFQPVPTNTEFYFCVPATISDNEVVSNDDENDEISSDFSEFLSKSDQDSVASIDKTNPHFCSLTTPNNTTEFMEGDDEITPLFLQLTCTLTIGDTIHSIPVNVLPTCLGEICKNVENITDIYDSNSFRITLDIICLTLPIHVQTIITESTSSNFSDFDSLNGMKSNNNSNSLETNIVATVEQKNVPKNLNHLPEFQQKIIRHLKDEIKWLLHDEMATFSLDLEPVTTNTLNMVIHHVETSSAKISCKKDVINLNFVYGASHSRNKFVEEFQKLQICMPSKDIYKLNVDSNLYYLAKDTSPSNINNCCNTSFYCFQNYKSNRFKRFHRLNIDKRRIIDSDDIFINAKDSKNDKEFDWLNQIDRKRSILPNFWLILRLENDLVTIFFHCRFLELVTSKVSAFLDVHNTLIMAIKDLCKRVNQSLLLQQLHDTKNCDRLLEPEDPDGDLWNTPIPRKQSFANIKHLNDFSDNSEFQTSEFLKTSSKFIPGAFRCDPVWQTHFLLHPRLKTGPGKSGISRGIQALRTVLNKFSVNNRNNMFVYQDSSSNVFYLKLQDSIENGSKLFLRRLENENVTNAIPRSPSITSLPIAKPKSILNHSDSSNDTTMDIRPRVRSVGENEITESPAEDSIILKVYGITNAGPDVKCDLVQVLQNRLDDAVLEILSMMLARNSMCPLTPEDVQFLQKPFCSPGHITKLFIPEHAHLYLDAFIHYLRQNLLQFLNLPKYADSNSYYHFKDYPEPNHTSKVLKEDLIFLYNQSQNPSSGSRGIACVALTVISTTQIENNFMEQNENYTKIFDNVTFDQIVSSYILSQENENLPNTYLEFHIWKQGRVNLDVLCLKLKSAVSQALWDLVSEYHLLRAPLCNETESNIEISGQLIATPFLNSGILTPNLLPLDPNLQRVYEIKSCISRKLQNTLNSLSNDSLVSFCENHFKSSSNYLESANASLQRLSNDLKLTQVDQFERGDFGVVSDVYSTIFVDWFEYAIKLDVPAVKKCQITLTYRHSVGVCLRELQNIINFLAPDTTVKAFDFQNHDYVPHKPDRISTKSVLIGRNLDQWKMSTSFSDSIHYPSSVETMALKHHQKFIPYVYVSENKFIPRQRLLLAIIISNKVTLYMYNWSKERIDKLVVQSNNLGMWLSARASVLISIVAQKRGLFHNQLIFRKSTRATKNPYLYHINETPEYLYKFPSKDWTNRKLNQTRLNMQDTTSDAFRDIRPSPANTKNGDVVIAYSDEMHNMKNKIKIQLDEKKKIQAVWQSRGATSHLFQSQILQKHARIIHYCHTPLLFLPRWRLMSAATRDHTLGTEILDEENMPAGYESSDIFPDSSDIWHNELCLTFVKEYKQYLQTLGFVPLEAETNKRLKLNLKMKQSTNTICYVHKPMLGGIMVFIVELKEPFFIVKLLAIECCRLQQKISRNLFNQFTLSFLDECDRIKSLMHLHSFTYDFHLRCLQSYAANNSGVKVCVDYHLTHFLDDFNKYYPKTPNFARNVVVAEIMDIENLLTEGEQLYTYLLSNNKHYGMNVLSMKKEDDLERIHYDYVLIQVNSMPKVSYKDSQDRPQTDDFDVTLIITNLGTPWLPNGNVLRLKFYIIVTSCREIYPKCEVEKSLGIFRTVSSSNRTVKTSTSEDISTDIEIKPTESLLTDSVITSTEEELDEEQHDQMSLDEDACENDEDNSTNLDLDLNEEMAHSKTSQSYSHMLPAIKQESVDYLGYYSSHEQLMQQLMKDQASKARQKIRDMVTKGMIHCRTHLLWQKLVLHQDSNHLTYNEFMELRRLVKIENLIDFHPDINILLDHSFFWYQGLIKLIAIKYQDQHRIYVSPDGNIQHLVVLHPRYMGTFMMVSTDFHTSRGDLYAASSEPLQFETSEVNKADRKELINGFINCIAAYVWSGMVQS